jgi:hypothetical protein
METKSENQLVTLTVCYDSFKIWEAELKISLHLSDICRRKWHLHPTQRQQPTMGFEGGETKQRNL